MNKDANSLKFSTTTKRALIYALISVNEKKKKKKKKKVHLFHSEKSQFLQIITCDLCYSMKKKMNGPAIYLIREVPFTWFCLNCDTIRLERWNWTKAANVG